MANSVDPEQTGAVCTGSTLFASILNSSVMLGNYLQQTTSADTFSDAFLLDLKGFGDAKGSIQLKVFYTFIYAITPTHLIVSLLRGLFSYILFSVVRVEFHESTDK